LRSDYEFLQTGNWEARHSGATRSGEPGTTHSAIPASLFNACFVLFVINASFFPPAYFTHWWMFGDKARGMRATSDRIEAGISAL